MVLGTAFGPDGKTPGPSPMELVLLGTGGCSAYDVVHILEKGREASSSGGSLREMDDKSVQANATELRK
ncbi:putative OsmC-like protein [Mesorhizobium robiniae]|uniref:OsmC-like protein n=1 Tax=Mesorhizobium robiniae TaxID=559315 RepID=A0ABV2GU89_9HYPH